MDAGVAPLKFNVEEVKTSDPLFVNVECEAGIKLDDPDMFYLNLYKGGSSLSVSELAAILEDEVREALQEEFAKLSVKELSASKEYKGRLEQIIDRSLSQSLRQYGLRLQILRTLSVDHAEYDAIAKQQEEYLIAVWEQESALVGRKTLFDVKTGEELQSIFETTKHAELEEQRLGALSRLHKAVNTGKMDEVRSKEELEEFKRVFDEKRTDRDGNAQAPHES